MGGRGCPGVVALFQPGTNSLLFADCTRAITRPVSLPDGLRLSRAEFVSPHALLAVDDSNRMSLLTLSTGDVRSATLSATLTPLSVTGAPVGSPASAQLFANSDGERLLPGAGVAVTSPTAWVSSLGEWLLGGGSSGSHSVSSIPRPSPLPATDRLLGAAPLSDTFVAGHVSPGQGWVSTLPPFPYTRCVSRAPLPRRTCRL